MIFERESKFRNEDRGNPRGAIVVVGEGR